MGVEEGYESVNVRKDNSKPAITTAEYVPEFAEQWHHQRMR
jgi:hypothetical protein